MSGIKSVVPGRARIGLKKVGLWVPELLMIRFARYADRISSTKTAELILALEAHLSGNKRK